NRTMTCYRDADEDLKNNPGLDPSLATVEWSNPTVNRPENLMTGVRISAQGPWNDSDRTGVDYHVRFANHWVFEGTGLGDNAPFGGAAGVVGYEVDGTAFEEQDGVPVVTGVDQTPLNLIVLATADVSKWHLFGMKLGWATMGIYRNKGTVITAATTNWSHGLDKDAAVSQI